MNSFSLLLSVYDGHHKKQSNCKHYWTITITKSNVERIICSAMH